VVIEARSPAEVNSTGDLVNMRGAEWGRRVSVADIDRGGAFAHLLHWQH
jgi:cobyric acid synthase